MRPRASESAGQKPNRFQSHVPWLRSYSTEVRALRGTHLNRKRRADACPRRMNMDKEHVKGAFDKTKGAVKDAVGKATGDKEMQAKGKMDKAKGAARQAAGDV